MHSDTFGIFLKNVPNVPNVPDLAKMAENSGF